MPINIIKDLFVRPYKRQGRSEFEESDRSYIDKELQSIEETVSDLSDAAVQIADNAPVNPRRGMIRIAIAPWDPGSGSDRGYFFDGTDWTVLDQFALASAAAAQAAVDQVEAALHDPDTGYNAGATYLSTAKSDIATNQTNISTNATAITALQSALDDPSTGYNAGSTVLSTLQTNVATNASGVSTNATAITDLQSALDDPATGYNAGATALSTMQTNISTNASNITTNASAITALETTVNDGSTGVAANASAISALETTVNDGSTGVAANASAITSLEATVGNLLVNELPDMEDTSLAWGHDTSIGRFNTTSPHSGSYSIYIDDGVSQFDDIWNTANGANVEDGWPVPQEGEVWTIGFWYKNTNTITFNIGMPHGATALVCGMTANTSTWTWFTKTETIGAGVTTTRMETRSAMQAGKEVRIDGMVLMRGAHTLTGSETFIPTSYAKATQTMKVDVDAVTGTANAVIGMTTDVNGNITGFESVNDGATSTFSIVADQLKFYSSGGGSNNTPFEVSDSKLWVRDHIKIGTLGKLTLNGDTYDATGIFLGYDSAYKFSIRNGEHFIRFDGTTLEASGDIANQRNTIDNATSAQHIIAESSNTVRRSSGSWGVAKYYHPSRNGKFRFKLEIRNEAGPTHSTAPGYRLVQNSVVISDVERWDSGTSWAWGSHFIETNVEIDRADGPIEIQFINGTKSATTKWTELRDVHSYSDIPYKDYFTPSNTLYPEIDQ